MTILIEPDSQDFYFSDSWRELRLDILDRDDYQCQAPRCLERTRLHVHHIIPRKYRFIVSFDIDSEENLITYCERHHAMVDHKLDMFGNPIDR